MEIAIKTFLQMSLMNSAFSLFCFAVATILKVWS